MRFFDTWKKYRIHYASVLQTIKQNATLLNNQYPQWLTVLVVSLQLKLILRVKFDFIEINQPHRTSHLHGGQYTTKVPPGENLLGLECCHIAIL